MPESDEARKFAGIIYEIISYSSETGQLEVDEEKFIKALCSRDAARDRQGREKVLEEAAVCSEHQDRYGYNHLTIAAAIRALKGA